MENDISKERKGCGKIKLLKNPVNSDLKMRTEQLPKDSKIMKFHKLPKPDLSLL